MSPSSPRQIQIDPHLPAPNRTHAIPITSPNALSPSRVLGPSGGSGHSHQHPGVHRGGSGGIGRSYRDDPEGARQRQMQQDIESAMSMSRARSGSITNQETSPGMRPSQMHYPSTSPIEEGPFTMLSDMEEAALERARSFHVEGGDGSDDEEHMYHDRRRSDHNEEERGEGMMEGSGGGHGHALGQSGSSGYDSHARLLPEHRGGHDVRTAGMGRTNFDFAAMEDFAKKEREVLGVETPTPGATAAATGAGAGVPTWIPNGGDGQARRRSHRGDRSDEEVHRQQHPESYDTNLERTQTMSAYGDDGEQNHEYPFSPKESEAGTTHFHRRRQRKLSQSNPVMRRQGKLALFEGFGSQGNAAGVTDGEIDGSPGPFKAPRQPKNLVNPPGGGFVPFTDATPGHDRPYRFSFYSNALPVTIHARTLAELPAEGQTFEDLFKGRNTDENRPSGDGTDYGSVKAGSGAESPGQGESVQPTANGKMSLLARAAGAAMASKNAKQGGGGGGPGGSVGVDDDSEAFTWWLDVLSPTDEEMRMLSRVFGIHPLTTEDILLEETREKIELFRNYYLVCFRSFDQDPYSQTYLEPLNMYIIVFREGTLSFHFRGTPHPQNVRRRIKHLKDYISVTSDWISYALIDDITDAFGPLIQSIEYEVDSIDELVLILKEAEQSDMLRRIGTCRKKVMGLLRLMGNKADVVKGLAKRCNEQWLVAPKSDIGLYLSDIQDHLITMTQNLNHYEKILSRSHSNYLAQISIEMTDANNQINDVLSKLTALGTVLIPMNLVTGLWGMNVHVPGEDIKEGYAWFGGIVGCLALFAILGAFATYKCFVR